MNSLSKRHLFIFLIIFATASMVLLCSDAFAIEEASKGRKLWDNVLLWVNFAILVIAFIKFGKNPLMNFLRGEQQKIEKTINAVDGQIKESKSLMEVEADKLKDIDKRLKKIREDIMEIGRREREKILEKAKITADFIIEDAKKEVQNKLEAAKKGFGEEILEEAVSIAVESLNKGLSQEDNDKIIEQFSAGLKTDNGLSAN